MGYYESMNSLSSKDKKNMLWKVFKELAISLTVFAILIYHYRVESVSNASITKHSLSYYATNQTEIIIGSLVFMFLYGLLRIIWLSFSCLEDKINTLNKENDRLKRKCKTAKIDLD